MRAIRPSGAARRLLAISVAVLTAGIGLVAGGPAAHAGPSCSGAAQAITLVNGWHSENSVYDTGDPSVCLENDGMVYLSGSAAAPSGSSEEFGTLPVWDWPEHNLYFDVYTLNSTYGVLLIETNGTMWTYGGSGESTGYLSLAGVSYPDPAVSLTDVTLENGWTSADSLYATGDPAYAITSGVVHLAGSMWRPAGSPVGVPNGVDSAVLPSQAVPPARCFDALSYNYDGSLWRVGIQQSTGRCP